MTHTDHTHTDDVVRELAVLQDQVNGLADPNAAAEAVAAELDYLYSVGADTQSLQVIHDQASVLLDASQQLGQAFSAALHVAQRIREQRNTAQEALAKLKAAVETADLDQPEVAQLFEELSEMAQEDAEMYFWDMLWEFLEDHIVMNTPLEWADAHDLTLILTGDTITADHALWDELRDWVERVKSAGYRG